jgi:exodeoxyribonuclease VII large subunit
LRGRHVGELSASLRHALASQLARRARRHETLRRALVQYDPRHRLGAVRARLVAHQGRLSGAAAKRIHISRARFGAVAARLEGLNPLAVLARGYAVAWDHSRTRILRDVSSVSIGDEIVVKLERGEITSTVSAKSPG